MADTPISETLVAIRDLVDTRSIRTQQELAAALNERGFRTTQATISRDVRELRRQ